MKAKKLPNGSTLLPDHRFHWRNYAWRAYVERLKRSDAPIFVGPWHGEIGFEVLYWIPFIEQFCHAYGISKERLVPISRGGASAWYGTQTGLELYAMRTPQQVRVENRLQVSRTGMFKQTNVTPFDTQVIRDAADTMHLSRYHVLHPAWLYTRLAPYWTMNKGLTWANGQLRIEKLNAPLVAPTTPIPQDFVAVRFYHRKTFEGSDKQVRPFIAATVATIARDIPVVILDSRLSLDDHIDLTGDLSGPNIHHFEDFAPAVPETNLAAMSAILARARGFVGTYGGFAQLALRLGVPSVSFYTNWGSTSPAHLELAQIIALRSGVPSYVVRVGDIPMLNTVFPATTVTQRTPSPLALQSA